MSTFHVTPSLMVGDIPIALPAAHRVYNPSEALAEIRMGNIAVLPFEGWPMVSFILARLGLSQSEIAERVSMARIGTQNHNS